MKARMIPQDNVTPPRLRALVVDDREDVAMGLALLLKHMGYTVQMASHAEEALEKGERLEPDVVFLDIGLPGSSGYEVCLEMRRRPWGAKAFIVAVTGHDGPSDMLRAASTGFDRHVAKPMGIATLNEILRTVEGKGALQGMSE